VGLAHEDPELPELRAWVEPEFAVRIGETAPCDVRVVGPAELASGGVRALRRHRLRAERAPLVVVVADSTPVALVRDCFRAGAADVVALSEAPRALAGVLRRAVDQAGMVRERDQDTAALATELGKRARQVESALEQLEQSYDETLKALVSALDLREQETADHSMRVALYALRLGLRLPVAEEALRDLYHGALLHDIGKIGIPDHVLLKPGSLSDAEWSVMRTHPRLGSEILSGISFLRSARDVPLCHHEAWDGSGYPAGMAGADIPLHARIFAVVDSYDALRSERPYKPACSHDEALPHLQRAAGRRLDPRIVACFAGEAPEIWERLAASASRQSGFAGALDASRAP
jgi:response regulator RpfG family c-di-GMP phosphodiesterase